MATIHVEVERTSSKTGTHGCAVCPVAKAISKHLPSYVFPRVGSLGVTFVIENPGQRGFYRIGQVALPEDVWLKIQRYDSGFVLPRMAFDLEIPNDILGVD